MQCAAARRLTAMLLAYPLLMTAAAFDIGWTLLFHAWTPPIVYTTGVIVIATALALSTHLVRSISWAAQIGAAVVSLGFTNMIVIATATELIRSGRETRELLLIAGPACAVPLALAAVIALSTERWVRRVRRQPRSPMPASRPLPTLVDLVSPTLVDEFEAPTVVESPSALAS